MVLSICTKDCFTYLIPQMSSLSMNYYYLLPCLYFDHGWLTNVSISSEKTVWQAVSLTEKIVTGIQLKITVLLYCEFLAIFSCEQTDDSNWPVLGICVTVLHVDVHGQRGGIKTRSGAELRKRNCGQGSSEAIKHQGWNAKIVWAFECHLCDGNLGLLPWYPCLSRAHFASHTLPIVGNPVDGTCSTMH